jgi:hypothetical protein
VKLDPSTLDRQRVRKLVRDAVAERRTENGACQLEAFEQALALASEAASPAFHVQDGWVDAVRTGLVALLEFFDEEPELAHYLVVHSAQGGDAVIERRGEVLDQIAVLLDDERAPARAYPPPLMAKAVASGVLGVLHERLCQPQAGPLVELIGPLMSFTVLPFLGVRGAARARPARRRLLCCAARRPLGSPQGRRRAPELPRVVGADGDRRRAGA